jgi:FAD/FMN-containing dehydrogenase
VGPDDNDPARHRAWVQAVSTAVARDALRGGYPNLLGPDDREQIADAYGANAARLRTAKARIDPDGIFSAIPLPTGSTS